MNKIDFVVLWVDGSDPEWLQERLQYQNNDENNTKDAPQIIVNDYRDWDLLKYWFRSVEKYAPWVNKIHFVTYGHLPSFLNVKHPKINIVNHKDFIPQEYLPTFSSHTIELNLHRIEGLSNNFVYFNDDMYLTDYVKPTDFFIDGIPKDSAVINPIAPSRYDSISNLMINNIGVINQNFNKKKTIKNNLFKWFNFKYGILNLLNLLFVPWQKFPGILEQHLPTSFSKTTYEDVWSKEYEILHKTCCHKIRNFKTDVNQWVLKEWQIASGNFLARSVKFGDRFLIESFSDAAKASRAIEKKKFKMICINDHYHGENLDQIVLHLQEAFDERLSKKSSFEI